MCKNGTGVSAQEIGNLNESAANATNTSSGGGVEASPGSNAATGLMAPVAGTGLVAGLLAWGLL